VISIVGIYLSTRRGSGPNASRKTLGIFVAIGATVGKGKASAGLVSTHSVAVFVDTSGVVLLSIPNVTYGPPSIEQSNDWSFGWITWKLS
jgi:hypothetical protein